jgi:RNase P protein component
MKESFRLLTETLPVGYDILFIARKQAADKGVKCGDVGDSMKALLKKCGLIRGRS